MKYLSAYPESLQSQVQQLQSQDKLGDMLLKKYSIALINDISLRVLRVLLFSALK